MEIVEIREKIIQKESIDMRDVFGIWIDPLKRSYLIEHMEWGEYQATLVEAYFKQGPGPLRYKEISKFLSKEHKQLWIEKVCFYVKTEGTFKGSSSINTIEDLCTMICVKKSGHSHTPRWYSKDLMKSLEESYDKGETLILKWISDNCSEKFWAVNVIGLMWAQSIKEVLWKFPS